MQGSEPRRWLLVWQGGNPGIVPVESILGVTPDGDGEFEVKMADGSAHASCMDLMPLDKALMVLAAAERHGGSRG